MVSLYPSWNPPSHAEALSTFLPPMHPNHPFAPPHPKIRSVEAFCKELHGARAFSSQCGIMSVQHCRCIHHGLQHESLLFDVIPLAPGTNLPQSANPPHTFLEVSRFKNPDRTNLFGIWGFAKDVVLIIGQESGGPNDEVQQPLTLESEILSTLSWSTELPNLVDIFDIIRLLSLTHPYHNIFTCQCFWFVRAIYRILRRTYNYDLEVTKYDLGWEMAGFLTFLHILSPTPPKPLVSFCQDKKEWSYRATVGRIVDDGSQVQP